MKIDLMNTLIVIVIFEYMNIYSFAKAAPDIEL